MHRTSASSAVKSLRWLAKHIQWAALQACVRNSLVASYCKQIASFDLAGGGVEDWLKTGNIPSAVAMQVEVHSLQVRSTCGVQETENPGQDPRGAEDLLYQGGPINMCHLEAKLRTQNREASKLKRAQTKGKAGECEAELGAEDVVHLGRQDKNASNKLKVQAEAGQLSARGLFSHSLRVRVQCVHAVLLALACGIICLAQTAGVRKMHVRLDIVGRKVACGASMPACGACACVGACPIIAMVFKIRASAAPLYQARRDALAPGGGLPPPWSLAGGERGCCACGTFQSGCCASGLPVGHGSLYALRCGLLD